MIRIPWRSWYGDEELVLSFPRSWEVDLFPPADAPDIGGKGIEEAFANPIGTPTIAELARGKRTVAIAVDDLSRPTPGGRLLPSIMRQLEEGGIDLDRVRVVMAVGLHRPLLRPDYVKKLGQIATDRLEVHNNFPFDNLADLGVSDTGTPVRICRFFAEADLKIGLGCITPHGGPGFGGGAKIVVPGVASYETISSIHTPGRFKTGLLDVEHNELRAEMEHIARDKVGLDCIANVVPTSRRQIAGLFVGDLVDAHRAGVRLARQVFATEMPAEPADVVITNAYPKDTEYQQRGTALNVLASSSQPMVKEGGTIVLIAASPEGRGYHVLYGPGMRCDPEKSQEQVQRAAQTMQGASVVMFAPWIPPVYAPGAVLLRRWDDLVDYLQDKHGDRATVAVFPCGSIQIATNAS